MTKSFRTIFAEFDLRLDHSEIGYFRKGLSALFGNRFPHLFNADRKKYPLWQFRVWKKKAALFGLNEGAEEISQLISLLPLQVRIGNRTAMLNFQNSDPKEDLILETDGYMRHYKIFSWTPFNSANFEIYKKAGDMHERLDQLQTILKNHLVAFAKEAGAIDQDHKLYFEVRILDITSLDRKRVKSRYIDSITPEKDFDFDRILAAGNPAMWSYDLLFEVNAQLPEYLGLGRNTSHGFGWVVSENTPAGNED